MNDDEERRFNIALQCAKDIQAGFTVAAYVFWGLIFATVAIWLY